jgi:hypothetical protein
MAIMVSDTSGGGNFMPHPEGSFGAVCVDVYDEGLVEETWEGVTKMKHKIRVYFFCGEMGEPRDDGEQWPLLVSKRFTATLHENGALRPWLEAWRGKKFTAEELSGFDVESLLAAPAIVQVTQVTKGDRTYANIDFAGRLPKGMVPPEVPAGFKRRHIRDAEKAQQENGNTALDALAHQNRKDVRMATAAAAAGRDPFADDDNDMPF